MKEDEDGKGQVSPDIACVPWDGGEDSRWFKTLHIYYVYEGKTQSDMICQSKDLCSSCTSLLRIILEAAGFQ